MQSIIDNTSLTDVVLVISMFTLVVLIWNNTSSPLTMKSYIGTTYMYMMFAILLIALINGPLYDSTKKIFDGKLTSAPFAIFMLVLIMLVILRMLPPKYVVLKHIAWLIIVSSFAIIMLPTIERVRDIQGEIIGMVMIMFCVVSYFAWTQDLGTFDTWYPYLISSLVGIIVFRLLNYIFGNDNFGKRELIFSGIVVVIFNGFVMYDTQKLIKDGIVLEQVCDGIDNNVCGDYPSASLNLILDVINLFSGVSNIM